MQNKYKNCQSCGMPFKYDPEQGGSQKDGTKSNKYCSFCYEKGKFLNPEIDTAKKMQVFCIQKMKEDGMNGIIAWIFTRGIPKLERWQK